MTKINRYTGNYKPFGANSQGTERTIFEAPGATNTQSDTLDANINTDYLRGWGDNVVGPGQHPTRQQFNAGMFTLGQTLAYLHQEGIAEWDSLQEFGINSYTKRAGLLFRSKTDQTGSNIGNDPLDGTGDWEQVSSAVFDSVTSMKLSSAQAGDVLETKGYTSAGDGGSAIYIVSAPFAADGFGDHILANGNVAVLQVASRADSRNYGTSTEAIQACLNANSAVDLIGVFTINATLNLNNGQDIRLYGEIRRDIAVPPFDMIVADGKSGIKFIGGKIDGMQLEDVSIASNRFCGIRVFDSLSTGNSSDVYIANVEVTRTTSGEIQAEGNRGAIILEDTARGVVDNCSIYSNRATSIMVQGAGSVDCSVLNCSLRDNDQVGSGVSGNSYLGLIVRGNKVSNTKYSPISVNGKNSNISGNTVYNGPDNYAGITIGHNSAQSNASGTVCMGNTVRDCGTTTAQVAGIVITNSDDVVIVGNVIRNNSSRGIRFLGPVTDAVGRCKVSNNIIEGNGSHGIIIDWGVGHDINGNTITANTGSGVYVDGAKLDIGYPLNKTIIRNNLLKDNGTTSSDSGVTIATSAATPFTTLCYDNVFFGDGSLVQANGIWASGSPVLCEARGNDFNSSYTEALAYRVTGGGAFKFKADKAENVNLITSPINGWSAGGGLGYWRSADGTVHLQGFANGGTVSTAAFNLPVGYRPSQNQSFSSVANSAHSIATVQSNGDVVLYTSNVNHYVSGISFRADTSADAS